MVCPEVDTLSHVSEVNLHLSIFNVVLEELGQGGPYAY